MSSHTSPAPTGAAIHTQTEEYSCFSRSIHIFNLIACSLCWKVYTTHTRSQKLWVDIFIKGFYKYTACPITDTLTASHVTCWEASGHWLTVLRITRFKRHRQIICCFEASTWWFYPQNLPLYIQYWKKKAMSATFCVYRKWIPEYSWREEAFKCSHALLFAVLGLIYINLLLQFIY